MAEGQSRPDRGLRRLIPRLALILLASWLQFHHTARDQRLHPDEAHFLTFARGAAVPGDWLLPGALDKPPLSLYLGALSFVAVGVVADEAGVLHLDGRAGEFAGRLPNALLAILLVALMLRLARRLYRRESAALLASLMTATSPFLLAFGASAFTDISLLFWSLAALMLALERRFAFAGIALGLAFWSKQQAVFFVPLVMALLAMHCSGGRKWSRFALPLAVVCGGLLLWDAARPEASIFALAAANNAPAEFVAPPSTWLPRLSQWLSWSLWLLGPPLVTVGVMALAVGAHRGGRQAGEARSLELIFLGYSAIYVLAHVVFSFNLYDRYLLPLLPLLILPLAGALASLIAIGGRRKSLALACALALLLGAGWSLQHGAPIGGGVGARHGIDELADYLNSKPVATVIYDPWLGWELGYYLGVWHDKRRVHYPTAAALVEGALALDEHGERYFVAPLDQPHDDWLAALDEAGFGVTRDYQRDGLAVYRLRPP